MACHENAFCSALPDETRRKLCGGCHKHHEKAGSFQLYESFSREAVLVLEGAIAGNVSSDGKPVGRVEDLPRFGLALAGRILNTDMLAFGQDIYGRDLYFYSTMECLTDCVLASFDHRFIRELAAEDGAIMDALFKSTIELMGDQCMLAAVLREKSVMQKVHSLQELLGFHGVTLTQERIAYIIGCNRASVIRALSAKDE